MNRGRKRLDKNLHKVLRICWKLGEDFVGYDDCCERQCKLLEWPFGVVDFGIENGAWQLRVEDLVNIEWHFPPRFVDGSRGHVE